MWLIGLGAAAIAGVLLGDLHPLPLLPLLVAVGLAITAALATWRSLRARAVALAIAALALGATRASAVTIDRAQSEAALAPLYDREISVQAQLTDAPALTASGKSARLLLQTESPPVQLTAFGPPALLRLQPGDRLSLSGRLEPSSDARRPPILLFATVDGAPDHGPPTVQTLAASLRQRAQEAIRAHMPEPQAALATGILLGGSGSGGLDPDVRLALRRSGLAHIVAIDGYKQVLLAGVVGAIGIRALGAYWSRVPVLLCILGYTLLTGAHPSAVRAGIMVALATLATVSGRSSDAFTSLAVATTLMALVEPPILLDVGLQLSAAATLGIILLWPLLRRRLRHFPRWLVEPAGLTLAVTVATLPIELAVFQSVSLVSPLAHIAAAPLLPVVFGLTALVAASAPVPLLAHTLGALSSLATTALLAVIRLSGTLPGAALETPRLGPPVAATLALALLAAGLAPLPEFRAARAVLARVGRGAE